MKKKIIAGAVLVICSSLAFVGCENIKDETGDFSKKEYILSIDQSQNFFKELKLSGYDKKDVILTSSSPEIIEDEGDGIFVARSSGSAVIEARVEDKLIASCKVVVKYKLALPKNFSLSQQTGVLSWDKSFAIVNGKTIYANQYLVKYQMQSVSESEEPAQEQTFYSSTNFFSFSQKGAYKVKVKALVGYQSIETEGEVKEDENAKYVDESDYSSEIVISYGQMGQVEEFTVINSENIGEEKAVLSWKEKENALYDVYVQGFLAEDGKDLTEAKYTLDFSADGKNIAEGEEVEIKIVAKDRNGISKESETIKTLKRLEKPELSFVKGNDNGQIALTKKDDNATYEIEIVDAKGQVKGRFTDFSTSLDGFEEGIYQIRAYAKGGNDTLSSMPTAFVNFAKLGKPNAQIDIVKKSVTINFGSNDYVDRYKVVCGGITRVVSSTSSPIELDLSSLRAGEYNLQIIALPKVENGEIQEFAFNGLTTSNVLNSDKQEFSFTVLSEMSEITHFVENGVNKFRFNKVPSASDYVVEVNGQELGANAFSWEEVSDSIVITLPNLSQTKSSSYNVKITAIKKENDKIVGIETSKEKVLTVLGKVSASSNQTNGTYTFNKISQTDKYYYEIFKTNSNYEISGEADYSGLTTQNKIQENFGGGYYKIRIWSKSTNENIYLDSDFNDENGYFEDTFFVTDQLENPNFVYDKQNNLVTIERSQNCAGYEIYVNSSLIATLDLTENQTATYKFASDTFTNAGEYVVGVKATSGSANDANIYKSSNLSSVKIVKLEKPDYTLQEEFDSLGRKTGEKLSLSDNAFAGAFEFTVKGEKSLNQQNYINIYDESLGQAFTIKARFIAKESEEKVYYLDSEEISIDFERVSQPNDIEFTNGVITFSQSPNADDYHATVVVLDENGQEAFVRGINLGSTENLFNITEKLELLKRVNPSLANILQNASAYKISLQAVKNSKGQPHFISSFNGKTLDGKDELVINKLSLSTLTLNKEENAIVWTEAEEGSTYDVYINGTVAIAGLGNNRLSLEDSVIKALNLENGIEIKVKSNNAKYLSSDFSNIIYVKKLSTLSSVGISTNGEATFNLPEFASISSVLNDNSPMNFTEGDRSITISLSGDKTYKITLVGKDSENRYFLNSDTAVFTINALKEIVLTKSGNIVSWNEVAQGQTGISKDVVVYKVTVSDSLGQKQFITTDKSFDIQSLEQKLNTTFASGEIKIKVEAVLSSGYNINNNGIGYWGESSSQELLTSKLDSPVLESEVVSGDSGDRFDRAVSSKLNISYTDLWSNFENIKFEVKTYLKDASGTFNLLSEETLSDGDSTRYVSLQKTGNNYILSISQDYFAQKGEYKIEFVVNSGNEIESEKSEIIISRYDKISSLRVSDEGKITLVDNNNFASGQDKYGQSGLHLLRLTLAGQTQVIEFNGQDFSMKDFAIWADSYGQYVLEAICIDGNSKVLPSTEIVSITGTKLEGIESISCDIKGNLNVSVSETNDIIFSARMNGIEKDITLERKEGTNEYTLPLLEIVKQFNISNGGTYAIEMTVKRAGCVDSDWASTKFVYMAEDKYSLVKDENNINTYLVFEKKEDDTTSNFRIESGENVVNLYTLLMQKGYCNYDEANGVKSNFTFSQIKGENSYPCYAVELDSLLSSVEYGKYGFKLSRLSTTDGLVCQNNEESIVVTKLNSINVDEEEGDYLRIENSILRFGFENKTDRDVAFTYLVDFAYNQNGEDRHIQKIITSKSFDLRNAGLDYGVEYTISVKVLSKEGNVLSSNFNGDITTLRYTLPHTLVVENGLLRFSSEELKSSPLGQKVIAYAKGNLTSAELADFLYETTFTLPFYFNASVERSMISNAFAEVKLTSLNDGAVLGEEYKFNIPLLYLLPDFEIEDASISLSANTFFNVLEYLSTDLDLSEEKYQLVLGMTTFMLMSNQGVGANGILFDDLGREIPAGKYNVCLKQLGATSEYVDSEYSQITQIEILPAPAINLAFEEIEGTERNEYVANIKPREGATSYILQMRQEEVSYPAINIVFNGNEWIAMLGSEILEIIGEYEEGFRLNLNSIKQVLDKKGFISIPDEEQITIDIYEYNENCLAKSGIFFLQYHALDGDNMTFQNGALNIGSLHSLTTKILVRYQQTGLSEATSISYGQNVLLPKTGAYNYIIISLPGEIVGNMVYIESDRYMIENVYKLNTPILTSTDNNINIALAVNDQERTEQLSLDVSNNITNEITNFKIGATGLVYQAGALRGETSAEEYKFALRGNSLLFNPPTRVTEGNKADFKLEPTSSVYPVFSSENQILNAKMLSNVEIYSQDGNIYWSACQDKENTSQTIVYKVDIDYYSTSSSDTDNTPKETQTIYTLSTSISTNLFKDRTGTNVYEKYKLSVTPLAGSESYTSEGVSVVEGGYYTFKNTAYYNDNSVILRGQKAEVFLARGEKVTDAKVSEGKIEFVLNEGSYMVIAEFDGKSHIVKGEETRVDTGSGYKILFTPSLSESEGGLDENKAYNVTVYTYNNSQLAENQVNNVLLSKPTEIGVVYRLPELTQNRYSIGFKEVKNEGNTILDLSKYFSNIAIDDDKNCYQILVAYQTSAGDEWKSVTIDQSSANKYVVIDKWKTIEFIVQSTKNTSKNLIYSSPVRMQLQPTVIFQGQNQEVSLLMAEFNSEKQRFEWTWLDEREGEFEYFVRVTYRDGQMESATVKNAFYQPVSMGNVRQIEISARQIGNVSNEYLFSDIYTLTGSFDLDMFAGGNGTSSNPYIIENNEQFLNMAYRNEGDVKYYFALANDLELRQSELVKNDGSFLISSFKGNLDGQGHTIKFIADAELAITSASIRIMQSSSSSTNTAFALGCAMFEKIENGGVVENLNLAMNVGFDTTLVSKKILIAPLAIRNYGVVRSVNATGLEFTYSLAKTNTIYVGGIVGINYSEISSCSNTAEFDSSLAVSFGYGGIALANITASSYTGKIVKCFISGEKKLTLSGQTLHYGGIVITNSSRIELCGNDSNLTIKTSSQGKVYGGGICENQTSGLMSACYNNGLISQTSSSSGSILVGGIMYYISGGRIESLVSTTTKIEGSSSSAKVTINSPCYGTSIVFSVLALTETSINCSDGSVLKISANGNGYTASIV